MKLDIKYNYPENQDYYFLAELKRINLDKEREKDLLSGNGFIVSPTNGLKKDLKDENSIFSSKFGDNLSDMNQFANRFRCKCSMITGSVNLGIYCDNCKSTVKFVDDNPKYTGWLVIKSDEYFIIHPNLFKSIEFFIGKDFPEIIEAKISIDEDGNESQATKEDSPYYGIGMIGFRERFDEIMLYYLNKSSSKSVSKVSYYNDIMQNKDKIFTQSIPVFSTILRPFNEDQESFYYEDSNASYTKINRLITELNDNSVRNASRKKKSREQLLFDIQYTYMELYDNIVKILSGKKGAIRSLFAGRYNFTSRDVIVSDPTLRVDRIKLSYYALVELLQVSIINILKKSYNISYNDAYKIWYTSGIEPDNRVINIINSMIKHSVNTNGQGIPMIINRNPTIQYGSILQMFCVGITLSHTMEIPLQILKGLSADFDGDVLNVLYIINDDFYNVSNLIFNPRNAMYISRNDGQFNNELNHQKDTIINWNTLLGLGKNVYTTDDIECIGKIKNKSYS